MLTQSNKSTDDSQRQNLAILKPTKNPAIFNVEIHLPHKTIPAGKLDMSGEGYYRTKKKKEHLHRKLNSWGVNSEIIERFPFKWICLQCGDEEYITSKGFIKRFGKRLSFKNYEPQYFLELSLWGVDAVYEFEKHEAVRPVQLGLFGNVA